MKTVCVCLIFLCVVGVFSDPVSADITTGLVAWYKFDGNANDSSGYGHNGAVYGPILTPDRNSNPNSAYLFDGYEDLIVVADSRFLKPSQITVAAWVRPDKLAQSQYMICKGNDTLDGSYRLTQLREGSSSYYFEFAVGPFGLYWAHTPYINIEVGRWYHLAGTYDGETMRIYVDGVLKGTKAFGPISMQNSSPLYFGDHDRLSFSYAFTGATDDARIYDRPLSEADIKELYSGSSSFCLAEQVIHESRMQEGQELLAVLRVFRNEFLIRSDAGRTLIDLYYRHSGEAKGLLIRHPDLMFRCAHLLANMMPELLNAVHTGKFSMDSKSLKEVLHLMADIGEYAGEDMQEAIDQVEMFLRHTVVRSLY